MSEIKLSEELKEESKRNPTFFKVLGFPDIIFDIQALEAEVEVFKKESKLAISLAYASCKAENKRLKEGLKVIENHAYQYGKGEPYFLGIQRIFEKRKLKFTNGQ